MELENSADNMALEPYWATGGQLALRGPLAVAAPGRILNETYQSLGLFTERHANRAGYRLGFGPVAIVERIQKLIGVGLERESRLQEIRNDAGPKLKKNCLKLIGYAFPSESPKTQLEAFKGIVIITTRCPALRRVFLDCKHFQGIEISTHVISDIWRRSDDLLQAENFTFFLEFAAACLADGDIAPMMEENSPSVLWNVEAVREGLSIVERLLVASECGSTLDFSSHIAVRYLGGILECPSFWVQCGAIFEAIVKKLMIRAAAVLKDLGVDCTNDIDSLESTADVEGIDILCESILAGVQGLKTQDCSGPDFRSQYWYPGFSEIVQLLRHPKAEHLLPRSWSRAADEDMKLMVPTVYALQSVETLVLPVDVGTTTARSILPRMRRIARLWHGLSRNARRSDNFAYDPNSPEPGDVVSPPSQSPRGTPSSPVNSTYPDAEPIVFAPVPSPPNLPGSPISDAELVIPGAELDSFITDSVEEFHTSSDHIASSLNIVHTEQVHPLPRSVASNMRITSHSPAAAALVERTISITRDQWDEESTNGRVGAGAQRDSQNSYPVPMNRDPISTIVLRTDVDVGNFRAENQHGSQTERPVPMNRGLLSTHRRDSSSIASESGLFVKLPPNTYTRATAVASERAGALSILLKSDQHAPYVELPSSSMAPNDRLPSLPPFDPLAHPSTPGAIRQQMLRNEMSESVRSNLLWQRKLSRNENLGPMPRHWRPRPAIPLPRNVANLITLRVPAAHRQ